MTTSKYSPRVGMERIHPSQLDAKEEGAYGEFNGLFGASQAPKKIQNNLYMRNCTVLLDGQMRNREVLKSNLSTDKLLKGITGFLWDFSPSKYVG